MRAQKRDLEDEQRRFRAHQNGESLDDSLPSVVDGSPPPPTPADGATGHHRWAQARDKTAVFRAETLAKLAGETWRDVTASRREARQAAAAEAEELGGQGGEESLNASTLERRRAFLDHAAAGGGTVLKAELGEGSARSPPPVPAEVYSRATAAGIGGAPA